MHTKNLVFRMMKDIVKKKHIQLFESVARYIQKGHAALKEMSWLLIVI